MTTENRRWVPPKLQQKLKNELKPSDIIATDFCLKTLRTLRKSLAATVACYATERQLLHRIIYKNHNQHRNALFWRNIIQARRFATRIEEAGLAGVLDTVRMSFYSGTLSTTMAMKSAPWTQLPGLRYLESVLRRIRTITQLCLKAILAYVNISNALTRFSHSTAFLPLTTTLMGILARLCVLTIEFDHAARRSWECIHDLLQATESSHQTCRCRIPKSQHFFELEDAMEGQEALPSTVAIDVELGEAVPRPMADVSVQEVVMEDALGVSRTGDGMEEEEEQIPFEVSPPMIRSTAIAPTTTEVSLRSSGTPNSGQTLTKKKRRPKDEIDDIFG